MKGEVRPPTIDLHRAGFRLPPPRPILGNEIRSRLSTAKLMEGVNSRPRRRLRAVVAEGEAVTVSVGDTGVGIPAEHAERIFEPFKHTTPPLARPVGWDSDWPSCVS